METFAVRGMVSCRRLRTFLDVRISLHFLGIRARLFWSNLDPVPSYTCAVQISHARSNFHAYDPACDIFRPRTRLLKTAVEV